MKPARRFVRDPARDFVNSIAPPPRGKTRGETIASMMAGGMSAFLGVACLLGLFGINWGIPTGVVRGATIVLVDPEFNQPGKYKPGWWFVPEPAFWLVIVVGLLLAIVGVLASRDKRRAVVSLVAFGLNTLALAAGYALAFTDMVRWK